MDQLNINPFPMRSEVIEKLLQQNARILEQLAIQDKELAQLRRSVFGFAFDDELDALFNRELDEWHATHPGEKLTLETLDHLHDAVYQPTTTQPRQDGSGDHNAA